MDCHADCHNGSDGAPRESRLTQRAGSLPWAHDGTSMLTALQALPRDAELLAFEAACEDYCEREVDDYLAS